MHNFLLRLVWIDISYRGGQLPLARLIFVHEQAPNARKKPRHPLHAAHAPRLHLFEWTHEHFVTTKGIRAVLLDHVIGIDDVAARLRHLLIVLTEDNALIDQALKRLRLRQVTKIKQHLVPEARIQKMQDRVLRSADVQIDSSRSRFE